MFQSLSPQRRRFAAGIVGIVLIIAAFGAFRTLRGERLRQGYIPVVLVHGYGGDTVSMEILESAVERSGREAIAIALPDQGRGFIDDSARALADAVGRTRAAQIDLVGFSAGGVVVRDYIENFGGEERARRVVLLGAPNHGAAAAGFAASADPEACTGACADLTPGSSFLAGLNEGDETPGPASYTSIWTADDQTVTPPDSAVIEGAHNIRLQDVCPASAAGHSDLVEDPTAIGLILGALRGLEPIPSCRAATKTGSAALRI